MATPEKTESKGEKRAKDRNREVLGGGGSEEGREENVGG